jgi:hypothetical protein
MDWALAINRNREPLLRIVVALFAFIGLGAAGPVQRLAVSRYRQVLSLLRPAEWATRRLVLVAAHEFMAHGHQLPPEAERSSPVGASLKKRRHVYQGRVSFQLFDPRKSFAEFGSGPVGCSQPRLHALDLSFDPRVPLLILPPARAAATVGAATVNAVPLCRRLVALRRALEDLSSQVRRYVRWQAKPVADRRPRLLSPLRPGPPPGFRRRRPREVDAILRECHALVCARPVPLKPSDTS